jgi:peptidyl-prolyl cis-trans isomerase B (cyclophilin B)
MSVKLSRLLVVATLVSVIALTGCDAQNRGSQSTGGTTAATTPTPTATAVATPTESNSPAAGIFAGLPRLNGKATIEMVVANRGKITIEVDGNNAPITAGNFVDLVNRKFYDGLNFHRVEKTPQPFVVQGGDPKGNGTGGFIDPTTQRERTIPLEIKIKGGTAPTYSQPIADIPALTHKRGAIAMARTQFPDSASSQFYFALAQLDNLDGSYAVFGYVTPDSLRVIDSIQRGDKITSVRVTKGIELLQN